jgi:hypothetical protein
VAEEYSLLGLNTLTLLVFHQRQQHCFVIFKKEKIMPRTPFVGKSLRALFSNTEHCILNCNFSDKSEVLTIQ